jgi:hypothetical protein
MRCGTYINTTGFQGTPLKVPIPSAWKLVDGHWYWMWTRRNTKTPFSLMNQESIPIGAAGSPSVAAVVPTAEQMQALADQLKTLVRADKTLVNLSPGASDQITLTNTSAGWMSTWITWT